jgi:hypothetical protein
MIKINTRIKTLKLKVKRVPGMDLETGAIPAVMKVMIGQSRGTQKVVQDM